MRYSPHLRRQWTLIRRKVFLSFRRAHNKHSKDLLRTNSFLKIRSYVVCPSTLSLSYLRPIPSGEYLYHAFVVTTLNQFFFKVLNKTQVQGKNVICFWECYLLNCRTSIALVCVQNHYGQERTATLFGML